MKPEILLLVGLPGCGKTAYVDELRREGWECFDDFKSEAINNSPEFKMSSRFQSLLVRLRAGSRCAIADIDFCRTDSRREAMDTLAATVPGVLIRCCFFANDVQACERNIRRRDRDSLEEDLRKLRAYSSDYLIPERANSRPVLG